MNLSFFLFYSKHLLLCFLYNSLTCSRNQPSSNTHTHTHILKFVFHAALHKNSK